MEELEKNMQEKELTREEEREDLFLKINKYNEDKWRNETYEAKVPQDIGEFIVEILLRLGKAEQERMNFLERYSKYQKDLEVIKEQEAITKSIIGQLTKNGVAQVKISYSDKKHNDVDKIYDFSYNDKSKIISLNVTTLTHEKNKEKPKEKIEKFEFPFKKYYLEKEENNNSSEKNTQEVPKQELPKEEKTEIQNTKPEEKKEEKESQTNVWAEKVGNDKESSLDKNSPWNKENATSGIDKDNPWLEKFSNDKESSLDIGLGIELE